MLIQGRDVHAFMFQLKLSTKGANKIYAPQLTTLLDSNAFHVPKSEQKFSFCKISVILGMCKTSSLHS